MKRKPEKMSRISHMIYGTKFCCVIKKEKKKRETRNMKEEEKISIVLKLLHVLNFLLFIFSFVCFSGTLVIVIILRNSSVFCLFVVQK